MVFRGFIAVELSGLEQITALIDEIGSLKAPFKLVQSASEFVEEESSKGTPSTDDFKADGP